MTPFLQFRHIDQAEELTAAFPVMQQLRPHWQDVTAFVQQVFHQHRQGYRLLAAWENEAIMGLAGYRQQENLLYGQYIYLDDLVVTVTRRGTGLGAQLLDVVRQQAIANGCANFILDTGLHMFLAQRFYFRQGMLSKSMGFIERL